MIYGVTINDRTAQIANCVQSAGLSGAGAAGNSKNDLPFLSSDGFEASRLFQTVADGKAKPLTVRALRVNLRHILAVKGTQGIKNTLCLNTLVLTGAKMLHNLLVKKRRKFVKADDAISRLCQMLNRSGRGGCRAGNNGDRGLGRIVTVLHAWCLRLLTLL